MDLLFIHQSLKGFNNFLLNSKKRNHFGLKIDGKVLIKTNLNS
jgi:hypothetical protein